MPLSKKYEFTAAKPVWETDKEKEMNHSLIFRAVLKSGEKMLKIAAHSKYQIFVNGIFFADGPARAAHGFFRVNEYSLSDCLNRDENCLAIITAGYNANSFYLTDQPSFLCAEITENSEILYATGSDREFEAVGYTARLKKVQRYSFQRPFTENYMYGLEWDAFLTDTSYHPGNIPLSQVKAGKFTERNIPYCRYREINAARFVNRGFCVPTVADRRCDDRSFTGISERLKGFPQDELSCAVVDEIYAIASIVTDSAGDGFKPFDLRKNGFAVMDMGVNTTGFIHIGIEAREDMTLYAIFNETMPEDNIPDAGRMGCANAVCWNLEGGREYNLVSFEPYTYKYIQLISAEGASHIKFVSQYRETYDETLTVNKKEMPTESLRKIYNAAYETFCQNATDIFMDCPSRERAGWLCDSFFTSRVEKELTGKSLIESNFLENFILPESFACLPEGMLPMCYPADHYDGCYIPNWSMWYVLEAGEYLNRSGDRELIDAAKEKILKLAGFFEKYENEEGLLQKLDSWVFIEWSKANDYVQDISYPSNMLYALFLDAVTALYGETKYAMKAEKLRQTIRKKAFNGKFFIDNAVLDERGTAINTENITETNQYYAFFSKTATKEAYPELWDTMVNAFGPVRKTDNKYPEIPESNAFIGNYLRLQLLFDDGQYKKLTKEITDFFLPMAEQTGTLWENMTDTASCNHGFASHVIYWLNKIYQ